MSMVAPNLPENSSRQAIVAAAIEASRMRREHEKSKNLENDLDDGSDFDESDLEEEEEEESEEEEELELMGTSNTSLSRKGKPSISSSTRRREIGFELMKGGLDDSGISIRDLPADLADLPDDMGKSSAYTNDSSGLDDSGISMSRSGGDGQRRRRRKPKPGETMEKSDGSHPEKSKRRSSATGGEAKRRSSVGEDRSKRRPSDADLEKSKRRPSEPEEKESSRRRGVERTKSGDRKQRRAPERTKSGTSSEKEGTARNLPERSKSSADGTPRTPRSRRLSPTRSGKGSPRTPDASSSKDRRMRSMADASERVRSRRGSNENGDEEPPKRRIPPTPPRSCGTAVAVESPRRPRRTAVDGPNRQVRRTRTSEGLPNRRGDTVEDDEGEDNSNPNNDPTSPGAKPAIRRTRSSDDGGVKNSPMRRDRRTSRRPTSHAAQALVNAIDSRKNSNMMIPGMAYMNSGDDDESCSDLEKEDMDESKADFLGDSTSTMNSTMDESVGGTKRKNRLKKLNPLRIFKSSKDSKNVEAEEGEATYDLDD